MAPTKVKQQRQLRGHVIIHQVESMNRIYLSGTVAAGRISRGSTSQPVKPLHHICKVMLAAGAHRSLRSRAHVWYPVVTCCLQVTLLEVTSQPCTVPSSCRQCLKFTPGEGSGHSSQSRACRQSLAVVHHLLKVMLVGGTCPSLRSRPCTQYLLVMYRD